VREEQEASRIFKEHHFDSCRPIEHLHNTNIEHRQARIATKAATLYLEDRLNFAARQIALRFGPIRSVPDLVGRQTIDGLMATL
jgi:hypothetical protein